MAPKLPKRPRDLNQLGKFIVEIASGAKSDAAKEESAAASLGRKGGAARAASLSADERRKIAKKAASKRWNKP